MPLLAHVPFDAAGAQVGPDQVVVDRLLGAYRGDVGQALDADLVVGEERVVFLENWIEMIEVGDRLLAPARRQVPRHAADTHVVEGQPGAAQFLDQVVDHFALAQRVQKGRHRSDVHPHQADREQMRRDTVEFGGDHPTVLAAARHLDAGELLARHPPTLVSEHRAHVVDTVGIRHEAVIADFLGDLLDRAMQVADVGHRLAHHFAVGANHETQHPVSRGMLRPHVEGHFLGAQRWFGRVAHFFLC